MEHRSRLDKRLASTAYLAGDTYTLADIAAWPWYGGLVLANLYKAAEFLAVHEYTHVVRWATAIRDRPAVQRGAIVNRSFGNPELQLPELHAAADIDAILAAR